MYELCWKVSRYAILYGETVGERNTQGMTHLWLSGRFSMVVWGICCKTLCGDLWGLMLMFFSFIESPSLATFNSINSIWQFQYLCRRFVFIPNISLPKSLLPMCYQKQFNFNCVYPHWFGYLTHILEWLLPWVGDQFMEIKNFFGNPEQYEV